MRAAKRLYQDGLIYVIAGVVLFVLIIAFYFSMSRDQLTGWATVKSHELDVFVQHCENSGGKLDVRPQSLPPIIFTCQYVDRTVEYRLDVEN